MYHVNYKLWSTKRLFQAFYCYKWKQMTRKNVTLNWWDNGSIAKMCSMHLVARHKKMLWLMEHLKSHYYDNTIKGSLLLSLSWPFKHRHVNIFIIRATFLSFCWTSFLQNIFVRWQLLWHSTLSKPRPPRMFQIWTTFILSRCVLLRSNLVNL